MKEFDRITYIHAKCRCSFFKTPENLPHWIGIEDLGSNLENSKISLLHPSMQPTLLVTDSFSSVRLAVHFLHTFCRTSTQSKLKDMKNLCHNLGCSQLGAKFCGGCGASSYCSVECQKDDWKAIHKICCKDKLPEDLLSLDELDNVLSKIFRHVHQLSDDSKTLVATNIMEKLLTFLEHQFGDQVHGKSYCLRQNGRRIDDFQLFVLRRKLSDFYYRSGCFDEALQHCITCRSMLEPRRKKCEEKTLHHLTQIEVNLSLIYFEKSLLIEAQHHGLLGLDYARRYRGDESMKFLFEALRGISDTLGLMGEYQEALEYGKECYLAVSELYSPEHSDVQQAVSQIVDYYSLTENYSLAYDYARFNYETLVDPRNGINSEHFSIGTSMRQIANIWVNLPTDESEGLERSAEAETFARKACIIMLNRYGRDLLSMSRFFKTMADVLEKKWSYSEESRMFIELIGIEYRMKSDPDTYFERNRLYTVYDAITISPHLRIQNFQS